MPQSICGTWDMISNANFDGYMIALGVGAVMRKLVLPLKHRKVVEQTGDVFVVKTITSFRNYTTSFRLDKEFPEFTSGLDGRHCKSLVSWEGSRLVCVQQGEKKGRGWTHWIEDDKLHLELYCEGQVCKQVFKKNV
ncbi:retinoid-binding protein 7a [Conger conger]|uniref:retinoid-binding protein 7a n=1 Tax=Conger conger TaxID=82655 RepID=UPI002A5A8A3D|nr:retinoid-binding protein 7a [Conger conger]